MIFFFQKIFHCDKIFKIKIISCFFSLHECFLSCMTHHLKSMTHHQSTRRWLCEISLFSLRREKKRKKCYSLTKIMVILKDLYEDSKMDFSTNQNIRILFKIIDFWIENFNLKFHHFRKIFRFS